MMSKNVPEDVVFEILSKLPVISLLRLRCVCKEWRLLLDSRYFISKHLEYSRTKKTTCILVLEGKTTSRIVNAFSLVSEETLDIVSPKVNVPLSNGSLLLGPINGIVSVFSGDKIFFCNPATREFKELPPCNYIASKSELEFKIRGRIRGFGFDEKSNDYKLVMIIHCWPKIANGYWNPNHKYTKIQIYSLASDSWRNLDHLTVPNGHIHKKSPNAYSNGACHWFVHNNLENPRVRILSFRMDTELFEEVPMSHGIYLAMEKLRPTVCVTGKEPDNLSVILHCPIKRIFEVWVMREYGVKESWSKRYTMGPLSISGLFSRYPRNARHVIPDSERSLYPMSIGNNDELLLCGSYGEFALYNIHTQKFRVLKAYEKGEATIKSAYYMESLVSFKRANGAT